MAGKLVAGLVISLVVVLRGDAVGMRGQIVELGGFFGASRCGLAGLGWIFWTWATPPGRWSASITRQSFRSVWVLPRLFTLRPWEGLGIKESLCYFQ